jgi:hypothetical protein
MAFFALMAAVSFFPLVGMAIGRAMVMAAGEEEEGEKEDQNVMKSSLEPFVLALVSLVVTGRKVLA